MGKGNGVSNYVTTNLNGKVRFRFIGQEGAQVWRDFWAPYSGGRDPLETIPADKDGWRETQLHNLMQTISHSFRGCYTPIETDIQVEVRDKQ